MLYAGGSERGGVDVSADGSHCGAAHRAVSKGKIEINNAILHS